MIPLKEFQEENAEINNLCTVLNVLIVNHEVRQNPIVCELLERFITRVKAHINHEDRSVYGDLLAKHTPEADKVASLFIGNSRELKRIIGEFKRGWCTSSNYDATKHDDFVEESQVIFRLVCERIEFETNKIFPFFEGTENK